MHRLLARQLRRTMGEVPAPAAVASLLEAVEAAYWQADHDRKMLERSLELSSQELLQANADLRAIFGSAPDLFLRVDEDGKIIDASGAAVEIAGCWPAPIAGRLLAQTVELGFGARLGEALTEVVSSRRLVQLEWQLAAGRWVEARLQPLLDRHCLVVVRDLSARKRAELELEESRAQLELRVAERTSELSESNRELEREIAERRRAEDSAAETRRRLERFIAALPAVTYIAEYGADGPWSFVSPQIEQLIGVRPDELIGEPGLWHQFVHPEDRELLRNAEQQALAGASPFALEYRLRTRSGRVLTVRDQAVAVPEGERVLFQGVILDVSERRALEQQLLWAQKSEAIGRLAGGVAHDFNNLLTAIGGYAELLQRELPESGQPAAQVAEILRSTRRAASLTTKLLALGRRQVLQVRLVDLNRLVRESAQMLRPLLGDGINLLVAASPMPVVVRADASQLEQVLLNLALNARDAMRGSGRLEVRTALLPRAPADPAGDLGTAALVVSDDGEGMTEEVKAHLFEPFFTTKPPGQGTGLGLATVYGIVQQSGGDVRVWSRLGAGTRFEVLLPAVAGREDAVPPTAVNLEAPRGTETVLLAEDEPAVRDLVRHVLDGLGYRVLVANDGQEALEAATDPCAPAIDLLLTDVVMPRLGGRELAERLRTIRPGLRVLFASGYAVQSPLPADGLPAGSRDGYVQKPFSPSDLALRIRELLDR